jgi:hypothetical protein
MLWIQSQHLKEPAYIFLTLCKLYFTWILIENNHPIRWDTALKKSLKNLVRLLMITNHFKIRFINVNILSFNTLNQYRQKCFSFKNKGYLSLNVFKIWGTSSTVRLYLMITSTSTYQRQRKTLKTVQRNTCMALCYSN